ncbi:hypothetical protein M433DRAFT_158276 [Acidomyces richmondensis BFW]|nr:MAG: hypothetical protein FE78DRAFT_85167 [Acidomyces sp. 'richmondensis']KYG42100.1 hypothetical protein M433DRAFT_158276 [Acidomyces richmondensis BFW]
MSTLRNAAPRRPHRERAQPSARSKWGLLEKHKDYRLRAADHRAKKARLRILQQKARERNEDEFYFGMIHAQSVGGIKRTARGVENGGGGGKALGSEVVKLMKTQDAGYLRTVLQGLKGERERVEQDVVLREVGVDGAKMAGKKIVFDENDVDGGDDVTASVPGATTAIDSGSEADSSSEGDDDESSHGLKNAGQARLRKQKRHALQVQRRRLETLREREEKVAMALRGVEEQQARMAGTVGGVNKWGTKFRIRTRKR